VTCAVAAPVRTLAAASYVGQVEARFCTPSHLTPADRRQPHQLTGRRAVRAHRDRRAAGWPSTKTCTVPSVGPSVLVACAVNCTSARSGDGLADDVTLMLVVALVPVTG